MAVFRHAKCARVNAEAGRLRAAAVAKRSEAASPCALGRLRLTPFYPRKEAAPDSSGAALVTVT